jgi:hypothetical protein
VIVAFEGAPAIGKTTVSEELKTSCDCHVVPEVNTLFGKENRTSDLWYYTKQIERCRLSKQNQHSATLSILDGDVFQPIWFSALFPDENWGDFEQMVTYYRETLDQGLLSFPDKYVFFHAQEKTREQRETLRSERLGRSGDSILKKIRRYRGFAVSQRDYFSCLNEEFPDLVCFLESESKTKSARSILSCSTGHQYQDKELFDFVVTWCRKKRRE